MSNICVVFDVDDTLYLERDYVRSGFDAVGSWVHSNLGVGDFSSRAWQLFEAGQRDSTFQIVLQERGIIIKPELIGHMVNVYRNHQPAIKLLPDAEYCLSALKGRVELGLITDGPLVAQRAKCLSLGLYGVVKDIVYTGVWGEQFYKPHRRAYELFDSHYEKSRRRFIYVADNPVKDFQAPIALGWTTVRVRRHQGLYCAVDNQPDATPAAELENLWEFPCLVERFYR